jgi:hypothetical protein
MELSPKYQFWPAQKQAAITWIIARLVNYRFQAERRLSLKDYLDFIRRARWKKYHHTPDAKRWADTWMYYNRLHSS